MNPPQVISAQEWQAARDALLVPYGRQEQWEDSPEGWPQDRRCPGFARTTSTETGTDWKGIR